jgi:ubiquinone/menaquinone biosynthesis C-methylase UbiE
MNASEFDKFADEYQSLHANNIRASGESPAYFARYKVQDVAQVLGEPSQHALRVLDFGAGVGTSVPYFHELFAKVQLTCLDVSRKCLELGELKFAGQADFVAFDGKTIPFPDNSFDLTFAACVFHHIEHAQHLALLIELRRVLRPKGSVVIFEHNPYNPLTVHAVNTCPFDENAVLLKAGHLIHTMEQAGFGKLHRRYRIFFPRTLSFLRGLEPYLSWLPLGAQYSVFGRK